MWQNMFVIPKLFAERYSKLIIAFNTYPIDKTNNYLKIK